MKRLAVMAYAFYNEDGNVRIKLREIVVSSSAELKDVLRLIEGEADYKQLDVIKGSEIVGFVDDELIDSMCVDRIRVGPVDDMRKLDKQGFTQLEVDDGM